MARATETHAAWKFIECTCEHKPEEHDMIECDITECPCSGGWEWNG